MYVFACSTIHVQYSIQYSALYYTLRGAEAGGILGASIPHFFGLTPPTFWRDLKMGGREGVQQKLLGVEKNLGGKEIFRGCIKIFRG